MAGPRKGFAGSAILAPSPTMRTRNRRFVMHRREPSALMKSRRRIASPTAQDHADGDLRISTLRNGVRRSHCTAAILIRRCRLGGQSLPKSDVCVWSAYARITDFTALSAFVRYLRITADSDILTRTRFDSGHLICKRGKAEYHCGLGIHPENPASREKSTG
jgi:hypothetical protein